MEAQELSAISLWVKGLCLGHVFFSSQAFAWLINAWQDNYMPAIRSCENAWRLDQQRCFGASRNCESCMLEDEEKALMSQSAPAPLSESSRRLDVCLDWQLHALNRSQAGRFEVGDQLFWKMRQHTKLMNVDSLASPSAPKMLAGTIPK